MKTDKTNEMCLEPTIQTSVNTNYSRPSNYSTLVKQIHPKSKKHGISTSHYSRTFCFDRTVNNETPTTSKLSTHMMNLSFRSNARITQTALR